MNMPRYVSMQTAILPKVDTAVDHYYKMLAVVYILVLEGSKEGGSEGGLEGGREGTRAKPSNRLVGPMLYFYESFQEPVYP